MGKFLELYSNCPSGGRLELYNIKVVKVGSKKAPSGEAQDS